MEVGAALLDLALGGSSPGIAVVGTGKNVGKTVAVRAIVEAAVARGLAVGLTSIGRDGEAVDAGDAQAKPRLFLQPGTLLATARGVLPPCPAAELMAFAELMTAAGSLLYARVREPGYFEIVGPPTASGVRTALDALRRLGAEIVVLDGAVDRVAALAGGNEAIVVATGAASGATIDEVVDEVRAMAARLATPAVDPSRPSLKIEGGLTAADAAALIARDERRQVVVRDPSQLAMSGRAFLGLAQRLTVRCERPLRVVATTVASIGRDRYLEPAALARAVAAATGLPTFDVYADGETAA
ncbi:MAG TPA: hypothetical protein VMS32_03255 [Verrucomicrobiae bacterium]|jgi:hypothetical protein|nr:hypothetical protein [Verrucomicrobiae bacterium]